jgi:hypothetical protein
MLIAVFWVVIPCILEGLTNILEEQLFSAAQSKGLQSTEKT